MNSKTRTLSLWSLIFCLFGAPALLADGPGDELRFVEKRVESVEWVLQATLTHWGDYGYLSALAADLDESNYCGWRDKDFNEVLDDWGKAKGFVFLVAQHKPTGVIKVVSPTVEGLRAEGSLKGSDDCVLRYLAHRSSTSPPGPAGDPALEVATIYPHMHSSDELLITVEKQKVAHPLMSWLLSSPPIFERQVAVQKARMHVLPGKLPTEEDTVLTTGKRRVCESVKRHSDGACTQVCSLRNRRGGKGKHLYETQDRWIDQAYGDWHFFGVFDGHGGHSVSAYLADHTHGLAARLAERFAEDSGLSLNKKIEMVCFDLWTALLREEAYVGSTACLAAYNKKKGRLKLINVGDSRALTLVNRKSGRGKKHLSYETTDQTPKVMQDEIELRGGVIMPVGSRRVPRVGGRLALGASFGDAHVRGVGAKPEIQTIELQQDDAVEILVATDGLWDSFSTREVHILLNGVRGKSRFNVASCLANQKAAESNDDITVVYHRCTQGPLGGGAATGTGAGAACGAGVGVGGEC